jgi:hypothetical protein
MMNSISHSSFRTKERPDHESSSDDDDDDEVSFINPFATGLSGSMRKRSCAQPSQTDLGRFDPFNSTTISTATSLSFMNGDDYNSSSDRVPTRQAQRDRSPQHSNSDSAAIESFAAIGTPIQQPLIPSTEGFLEMEEEPSSVAIPPLSQP